MTDTNGTTPAPERATPSLFPVCPTWCTLAPADHHISVFGERGAIVLETEHHGPAFGATQGAAIMTEGVERSDGTAMRVVATLTGFDDTNIWDPAEMRAHAAALEQTALWMEAELGA